MGLSRFDLDAMPPRLVRASPCIGVKLAPRTSARWRFELSSSRHYHCAPDRDIGTLVRHSDRRSGAASIRVFACVVKFRLTRLHACFSLYPKPQTNPACRGLWRKGCEMFRLENAVWWFVALWAVVIGGWVANVVKLIDMLGGDITAMFVARCVGVFAAPLGAVLGFF